MKAKKLKSLNLTRISKNQKNEIRGGSKLHQCGGCSCVAGLDDMMAIDNANVAK